MTFLISQINTRSSEFTSSYQKMHERVEALRTLINTVHEGGGSKAQERPISRGKLLVRERINRLIDAGSAFLEISPLAAHEGYGEDAMGCYEISLGDTMGTGTPFEVVGGRRPARTPSRTLPRPPWASDRQRARRFT